MTSPTSGQGSVAGGPGQVEDAEATLDPDRSRVMESGTQIIPPGLVACETDSINRSIPAPAPAPLAIPGGEQFAASPCVTKERTTEEDPLASMEASAIGASTGLACAPSTDPGGAEASDGGDGGGCGGELAEEHARRRANITQPPRAIAVIRVSKSLLAVVIAVDPTTAGRYHPTSRHCIRTSAGRTITRKMATAKKKKSGAKRGALTRKLQIKVSPSQREAVIRASRRAKKPMATWVRDHILEIAGVASKT